MRPVSCVRQTNCRSVEFDYSILVMCTDLYIYFPANNTYKLGRGNGNSHTLNKDHEAEENTEESNRFKVHFVRFLSRF